MYFLLQLFLTAILLIIGTLTYVIVKPWLKMYRLKTLLGNRIEYKFHPVIGHFNDMIVSFKKYGDAQYHLK
jgi:hypothetical protein